MWEGNEECDDGNEEDGDACPTSCEDAYCGDGFTYQDVEECDDGNMIDDDICANDCTSNGIFYFGSFTQGQSNQQHCTDWNAFRAQLSGFDFNRIAMWSSQDMTGRECVGPEADQLCKALESGQMTSVMCNGATWTVGTCSGIELDAGSNFCNCNSQYTLRPCINNLNWGGIGTTSCNAPTQTMEVVCQ